MKVTYIHHSAFLVELKTVTLLFDYTEGSLLGLHKDKPLLVFASHRHGDHYSEKILGIKETHENIRFVLSDDISRQRFPKDLLEVITAVKPGKQYEIPCRTGSGETAEVKVRTFRSTDEGVAFLVEAEGKTIYHAGDLNNWRWEGEPDSWNDSMAKQYSEEVEKMAGIDIHVAFLPLDPRQEGAFYLGFNEYMRKTQTANGFPMHCWGNFSVIKRLKEMDCSAPYRDRIVDIKEDGQSFEIKS